MKKYILFIISISLLVAMTNCKQQTEDKIVIADSLKGTFWDPALTPDERIDDLVSKLTLEEKISQMVYSSPAIERLGILPYNWWNEALHGVARSGKATVFPQAIGLAATFDDKLALQVASAISDEARAKFNVAQKIENYSRYAGLTFWTPNINIFRDPRWGRGQETYGEDPYLTSQIGIAFVKGLQGDHPKYLKTAACAKHYVVHSGPEADRHTFDAVAPKKDFYETYLPAFEALVKEAKVEAVMCAYNRTYGEPCCGSKFLLQDILRNQWGFNGHIVSDCWALVDFHENHKVTSTPEESAAMALKAGVNLNCGSVYPSLMEAYNQGLVTEEEIDASLKVLLKTRFKLGLFDPAEMNPYNSVKEEIINCEEHRNLAREVAAKSIVMLKNNDVLPLKKDILNLYVVGHHAASNEILLGNYFGQSENMVSIIEGIMNKVSTGSTVQYKHATLLDRENPNPIDWSTGEAHESDAIVAVMGISGLLEGEEGEAIASEYKGDRKEIKLPQSQIKYLKKLRSQGDKPIILVLTGGSAFDLSDVEPYADAILFVWYPGEQGGNAVADVMFGDVNPSGRLPVTFPSDVNALPAYEDYSMVGRTYRYMDDHVLYPFGFGLSYSDFQYEDMVLETTQISIHETVKVSVNVTNTSELAGEEVVQLYIADKETSERAAKRSLKGFQRVKLAPGASSLIEFTITPEMLSLVKEDGTKTVEPGEFEIIIGNSSPVKTVLPLPSVKLVKTLKVI